MTILEACWECGFLGLGGALVCAAWRRGWGIARSGAAALAATAAAGAFLGLRDPLATMSGYTAALMVLNQVVPPLLLASVPPGARGRAALMFPGAAGWLLDPWVAGALFSLLTIAVSVPAVLGPTLANALFAAPLGALELAAGLLAWMQLDPALRRLRADWRAGLFAWVCAVPMSVVAVVWMLADHVLYAPYLDVICRWDVTPLQDQRWAGFVMLLAGLPLQIAGIWMLVRRSALPHGPTLEPRHLS